MFLLQGGLASYWHADRYKDRFPAAKIVVAPDSGFFFSDPTFPQWSTALEWVVAYMNSTAGLDHSCVTAMVASGEDPLSCRWPEVVVGHIEVPVFVMNSRYDPALDGISGGVGKHDVASVVAVGAMLEKLVNSTVLTDPKNAAFITSCYQHCGQWAQDQVQSTGPVGPPSDANVTIDGWTAPQALDSFFASAGTPLVGAGSSSSSSAGGGPRKIWMQQSAYPCKTCCAGGQE